MIGIYCFTNRVNNKKYIGQSRNLETRKRAHLRNFTNPNLTTYDGLFYRALRKYGLDNFEYNILFSSDQISQADLNDLEIYYINRLNAFKGGYNMNLGGRFTSGPKVLTLDQVKEIQFRLRDTSDAFGSISDDHGVSDATISNINSGATWNESYLGLYPIRNNPHFANTGGSNPNSKLSDNDVMRIREQFVNDSLAKIYEENKDLCSFSSMKKAIYGASFLHLPVYKKREKKWYLDGTCIDYPRLGE